MNSTPKGIQTGRANRYWKGIGGILPHPPILPGAEA